MVMMVNPKTIKEDVSALEDRIASNDATPEDIARLNWLRLFVK